YHLNLVDSIIRARYRNGWEQEALMTPGEVYRVQITLPPPSNLFRAGHRIRVAVSSSNFPRFDVNPGTGEPVGRHTGSVIARNTVHSGPWAPLARRAAADTGGVRRGRAVERRQAHLADRSRRADLRPRPRRGRQGTGGDRHLPRWLPGRRAGSAVGI